MLGGGRTDSGGSTGDGAALQLADVLLHSRTRIEGHSSILDDSGGSRGRGRLAALGDLRRRGHGAEDSGWSRQHFGYEGDRDEWVGQVLVGLTFENGLHWTIDGSLRLVSGPLTCKQPRLE